MAHSDFDLSEQPARHRVELRVLDRRTVLISGLSVAAALGVFGAADPAAHAADPAPAEALVQTPHFIEARDALLAGATPVPGKVTLELPEIAENGNFVPLTVTVDNPMTDEDYVKTIHILSTANPVARVSTYHLSPVNGVAKVQSRMRLAKTQEVVAIAQLSGGAMLIATALVKVTIGGCAS